MRIKINVMNLTQYLTKTTTNLFIISLLLICKGYEFQPTTAGSNKANHLQHHTYMDW